MSAKKKESEKMDYLIYTKDIYNLGDLAKWKIRIFENDLWIETPIGKIAIETRKISGNFGKDLCLYIDDEMAESIKGILKEKEEKK